MKIILILCCCCLVARWRLWVPLSVTPWTTINYSRLHRGAPGKNTGVFCHFLLQGIFPTEGSNPCLPCLLQRRHNLYLLSHRRSPYGYTHICIQYLLCWNCFGCKCQKFHFSDLELLPKFREYLLIHIYEKSRGSWVSSTAISWIQRIASQMSLFVL